MVQPCVLIGVSPCQPGGGVLKPVVIDPLPALNCAGDGEQSPPRSRKCQNVPLMSAGGSQAAKASALPLPRKHAHIIAVKNVLVDATECSQALAESSFKVSCAGGREGIT